eukprot:5162855-Prymnesium_polylepis.1
MRATLVTLWPSDCRPADIPAAPPRHCPSGLSHRRHPRRAGPMAGLGRATPPHAPPPPPPPSSTS